MDIFFVRLFVLKYIRLSQKGRIENRENVENSVFWSILGNIGLNFLTILIPILLLLNYSVPEEAETRFWLFRIIGGVVLFLPFVLIVRYMIMRNKELINTELNKFNSSPNEYMESHKFIAQKVYVGLTILFAFVAPILVGGLINITSS